MKLNFLRIIGPKPKDDPESAAPAAANQAATAAAADPASASAAPDGSPPPPESPPAAAAFGRYPAGGVNYLTNNPAACKTPEDPEQSRALAPHSVAEVYDYAAAYEERMGLALTPEQLAAVVAQAEAWLEKQDQEFLEYVDTLLDQQTGLDAG